MRNALVLGVLVVLILVGAGCNPFLDHLAHSRGECTMLNGPEHSGRLYGPSSKQPLPIPDIAVTASRATRPIIN